MGLRTQPFEKAGLVDGRSLQVSKISAELENINFVGLHALLLRIGICRTLAFPPVITVPCEKRLSANPIADAAEQAGFEALRTTSDHGADDEVLLRRLRPLSAERIKEIVIVTCDGKDFGPLLEDKAAAGIVVHWVGTKLPYPGDGRSRIGGRLEALIETKVFKFVDICDHLQELSLPHRHAGRRGSRMSIRP